MPLGQGYHEGVQSRRGAASSWSSGGFVASLLHQLGLDSSNSPSIPLDSKTTFGASTGTKHCGGCCTKKRLTLKATFPNAQSTAKSSSNSTIKSRSRIVGAYREALELKYTSRLLAALHNNAHNIGRNASLPRFRSSKPVCRKTSS